MNIFAAFGKSRHGFSLIELLVVIAIIGLLIAILIPVIHHVREAGWRTVCASNLSQVGKVMFLYANDNHGEIPAVYSSENSDAVPIPWMRAVVETKGAGCGGMRLLVAAPIGRAGRAYLHDARVLVCPGELANFPFPQPDSNGFLVAPKANDPGTSYLYDYIPPISASHLQSADWKAVSQYERHSILQRRAAALAIMPELGLSLPKIQPNYPFVPWHGAGGNVLYLDGHVTWIATDSLGEIDRSSWKNSADEIISKMQQLDSVAQ